ncbi:zinc-binding dehydrogenase [Crenobacter caeni]|uniref:Zinc-binding dehydrogenase n=1 Tax=Crenobacter caeni TaxID=2705474 RepID=A0A6B2KNQ9_9NEIS|nr:zinc-binding dehydrogenase [Crenobacter caeni]NDV11825.1 zinc-binding dehydrogenase [Crenobacter caeni]
MPETTMQAFVLAHAQPDFTLQAARLPRPVPSAGEVRLRVAAAALNPVDAKLCASGHPAWRRPHVPGVDAAGVIDEVGDGVDTSWLGQRVIAHTALARPGTFAQWVVTPAHGVSTVPADIDPVTAASLPCAALTAWQALSRRLRLQAGQTVLIEAAAGGVGGFAVQIAKALGARVIATASASNASYVASLGADAVIDYRKEDVAAQVRALTEGAGVDAVLDGVGGDTARRDLQLMKFGGQFASLLGLPDTAGIDLFARAPGIHVIALGGAWSSGDLAHQHDLARMGDEVLAMLQQGRIAPLPIEVIPADAAQLTAALHRQLAGRVRGKLVLDLAAPG